MIHKFRDIIDGKEDTLCAGATAPSSSSNSYLNELYIEDNCQRDAKIKCQGGSRIMELERIFDSFNEI
ncbi:14466_t:CDS:2 [Dentiscutata heterogama]|uniref:14466_t:CDS:1 n=1 Tax=Dentiscutata heterogama TaxID=1316150 RepID=A0ACA9N348_9GLOM|nr:14466_t:CDS:2 [Dentiscutata heterogama]